MLQAPITYGADPEAFLKKGDRIIGSERVIPKTGIKPTYSGHTVARDGVQIELHPAAANTPAQLISNIRSCFALVTDRLTKYPKVELCFDPVVRVEQDEMDSLSPESQVLGCQPSDNYYGLKPLDAPKGYLTRSAAGHIHIGLPEHMKEYAPRIVPMMDMLVGIPSVLLDRNPAQAERRKMYGRAGEYRIQPHGLEYRTPSNFWLHSPALADFVLGQTRLAVNLVFSTLSGERNYEEELLKKVDFRVLIKAIQKNSAPLANEILEQHIVPFNSKYVTSYYPLNYYTKGKLLRVAEKGLVGVFGPDPLANWKGAVKTWAAVAP